MTMKVCLILLYTFVMILVAFPYKATSLLCYKCDGDEKEPHEDPACSNVQNCTGAENSCMIRVIRYQNSEPQRFELTCKYKVDCKRLGTGCVKPSNASLPFTYCTECCERDLCNSPTFFKDSLATTVPPSQQSQIAPLSSIVITLAMLWFGYWITTQAV